MRSCYRAIAFLWEKISFVSDGKDDAQVVPFFFIPLTAATAVAPGAWVSAAAAASDIAD